MHETKRDTHLGYLVCMCAHVLKSAAPEIIMNTRLHHREGGWGEGQRQGGKEGGKERGDQKIWQLSYLRLLVVQPDLHQTITLLIFLNK